MLCEQVLDSLPLSELQTMQAEISDMQAKIGERIEAKLKQMTVCHCEFLKSMLSTNSGFVDKWPICLVLYRKDRTWAPQQVVAVYSDNILLRTDNTHQNKSVLCSECTTDNFMFYNKTLVSWPGDESSK